MGILEREMTTVTIVSRSEVELDLFLMEEFESLWSTKAVVCSSLLAESPESWCILTQSLALCIWSISTIMMWSLIRSHTDECESIDDLVHRILDETSPIGILDSHYELSLIVSCPQIGIEGSTQIADMQVSGWRWGETRTDSHERKRYKI